MSPGYIYIDIGDSINLVSPYYICGIRYNPKWESLILETVKDLSIDNTWRQKKLSFHKLTLVVKKINNIYRKIKRVTGERAFSLYVHPIKSEEIKLFGLTQTRTSSVKIVNQKLGRGDVNFYSLATAPAKFISIKTKQIIFVENNLEDTPKFIIPFIYTKLWKIRDIKIYHRYFPQLKLNQHLGIECQSHIKALLKLNLLPPFYNHTTCFICTIKYLNNISIKTLPDWFTKTANNYA